MDLLLFEFCAGRFKFKRFQYQNAERLSTNGIETWQTAQKLMALGRQHAYFHA
jgi:hypothetical protein